MLSEFESPDRIESEGQSLSLQQIAGMLRRRWLAVTLTALAILVPALIKVLIEPPVYESSATVSIAATPEVMSFGEEFVPNRPDGRRQGLGSEFALIESDRVLGRVIDQMPRAAQEGDEGWFDFRSWLGLGPVDSAPRAEEIRQARIDGLRRSLQLSSHGDGTVLAITTYARDAETAAFLANAIAEAFIEYKTGERREAARRAVAWLSERSNELRFQIEEREKKLSALAKRHGISPEAAAAASGGGDQLGSQLETARLDLLTIDQQLDRLKPIVSRGETSLRSAEQDTVRAQHATAKLELEVASQRFTPTHPEVQRLESIVRDLESRMDPIGTSGTELAAEYRKLQAQRVLLEARVEVLRKSLALKEGSGDRKTRALLEYESHAREIAIDRQLLEILLRRMNETVLSAATEAISAAILDPAVPGRAPVGPNRVKGIVLSIGFALACGLGLGVLLAFLDQRVYEAAHAAQLLGVPYLGVIPTVRSDGPAERQSPDSLAGECYRNLRTALLFSRGGAPITSLLVTSGVAGEGKTTVTTNLAASFAHSGRSVLLVDADLRRPRADKVFGIPRSPGLAELLRGDIKLEQAIRRLPGAEFDVITSGAVPENPTELLGSPRFDLVLSKMRSHYDIVVIDSAVMLAVSDPLLLAQRVDATLVVSRPGRLERSAYQRMRELFKRADARVLGLVFNGVEYRDRYSYPSYLRSPYIKGSRRRSGRGGSRSRAERA